MGNEAKWEDVFYMYTVSPIFLQDDEGNELSMSIADRQGSAYRLTPILRHRDDMIDVEAVELFKYIHGDDGGTYSKRHSLSWAVMHFDTGKYDPRVFHWFISRGFDVFGLIESGQAIRKEAGNG